MSPRRAIDEVERSLDAHRAELESALADLRVGARQVGELREQAQRYKGQLGEQVRERVGAQVRGRLPVTSDGVVAGAVATGFVAGGGVTGSLHLPFKVVRVVLGRPTSRNRLERAMAQDRYSKQVGRALAAVAAADKHMRSRRARLWRLVRPTPRRLVTLGSLGAGAFMTMTDDETRQTIETEARALLETIGHEISTRLEAVGQ